MILKIYLLSIHIMKRTRSEAQNGQDKPTTQMEQQVNRRFAELHNYEINDIDNYDGMARIVKIIDLLRFCSVQLAQSNGDPIISMCIQKIYFITMIKVNAMDEATQKHINDAVYSFIASKC